MEVINFPQMIPPIVCQKVQKTHLKTQLGLGMLLSETPLVAVSARHSDLRDSRGWEAHCVLVTPSMLVPFCGHLEIVSINKNRSIRFISFKKSPEKDTLPKN